MKRTFCFLLVLLLIPCMVVPASATTADAIWDTHDELGEWLGVAFADINDLLSGIWDRLDWLDSSVRDVETAIIQGLKTGIEDSLGAVVVGIKNLLGNIDNTFTEALSYLEGIHDQLLIYLGMQWPEDDELRDEGKDKQDQIDEITDIFATAPTINQDDLDDAISDIGDVLEDVNTNIGDVPLLGSLAKIAGSEIGRNIIPTSAMLGLFSYILFGKVF